MSSRDLYNNVICNKMSDGRIFMIMWDCQDEDLPVEDGCVRMQCPIGGFLFTPNKNDPTKC